MKKELVPSMAEMMAWTTDIFNQGIRRPGYPADQWAEKWVKEQFQALGLEDIALDPVSAKKWEFQNARLEIWLIDNPKELIEIPCFPIPYTTSTEGIEAELMMISENNSIAGKIGVSTFELFNLPLSLLKKMIKTDRYYDPEDEFKTLVQTVPFDLKLHSILDGMANNGLLGFIGILSGHAWETEQYYFPYDAKLRGVPGVWVSPNNGKKILDLIKKGPVMAKLSHDGKITDVINHNVIGTLPGMTDEWIVIGTHHDGPWNSAVEDASGMALVLAQAKYWSQVPKDERPFNLMFLMTCAHMANAAGAQAFINRNNDFVQKIVTAIHLEHVARDVRSENGKLIILDDPTVRWWFVSRIIALEEITENAIIEEDLRRSILIPPDGFPPGNERPPTDASYYHPKNVPLISFLTAPPYLFDNADTMDKIHQESFEPLTRAVIRIINALEGHTAQELRNQVLTKKERDKIKRKKNKISP